MGVLGRRCTSENYSKGRRGAGGLAALLSVSFHCNPNESEHLERNVGRAARPGGTAGVRSEVPSVLSPSPTPHRGACP